MGDDTTNVTGAPAPAPTPFNDPLGNSLPPTQFPPADPVVPTTAPLPEPRDTTLNTASPAEDADLLSIKQEALQQITPLLDHLEQTPEEKFRTTMMMIQSADNKALIRTAYEAAKQITDDKIRAQALLDIVNEINYFTQHQDK